MEEKILIGIPCYNCEKQVARVIAKLREGGHLKGIQTLLFVDNGSHDATVDSILKSTSKAPLPCGRKIFLNESNYGLGGSHKVIFNHAIKEEYDWVIILHGDDQANNDDILPMLEAAQKRSSTVLGARFMRGSKLINYRLSRIIGNRVLNLIFTVFSGRKVKDLGSGLNIFKVKELERVPLEKLTDSFNFNSELLLEYFSAGIKPSFFPIMWSEFDQVSNARNIRVALSMLKSLLLWRCRIRASAPLYSRLEDYTFQEYKMTSR